MKIKVLSATAAALAACVLVAAACDDFSSAGTPERAEAGTANEASVGPEDASGGPRDAGEDAQPTVEPPPPDGGLDTGCADGTREGFFAAVGIAACDGAWTVPGIFVERAPTCERGAGDDGTFKTGEGCSAQDLCAGGWHVCKGAKDVDAHGGTGKGPCALLRDDAGVIFYATAQPSGGSAMCVDDVSMYNDVFGCGDFYLRPDPVSCPPLNTNLTRDRMPPAFTTGNTAGNSTVERAVVAKGPGPGGVLCCAN